MTVRITAPMTAMTMLMMSPCSPTPPIPRWLEMNPPTSAPTKADDHVHEESEAGSLHELSSEPASDDVR